MKTYLVYVYGGNAYPEIDAVKAETPRQALNHVIYEWVQDTELGQKLSKYRIIQNDEYTIRYENNDNTADTLTFTIAGNKDIETVIAELHDNEVYTLEN